MLGRLTPGPHEVPPTPMLECLRSPLFKGPKGDEMWVERRLARAEEWLANDELETRFAKSVRLMATYRNHQPFYDTRKPTIETRGKTLKKTIDVAARLYRPKSGRTIWKVEGNRQLDFRFLDREIQIVRTKPGPDVPAAGSLVIDLVLANAHDRMPILCEMKLHEDQSPIYALVQLLTQASYAATVAQRERLVLFGSRPDFVLREAPAGEYATIDLYVMLVETPSEPPFDSLRSRAIKLSKKLLDDDRVGERIGRISWIEGRNQGRDGLTFSSLASFNSRHRSPRYVRVPADASPVTP
jgi:hypothetical protein